MSSLNLKKATDLDIIKRMYELSPEYVDFDTAKEYGKLTKELYDRNSIYLKDIRSNGHIVPKELIKESDNE